MISIFLRSLIMRTKLHNIFIRSPFYSLRVFYIFRLCLSGIALMFFSFRFNSDTHLADLLNNEWRFYIASGMILLGLIGAAATWTRNYFLNLLFAFSALILFGVLAYDYLRHDIRNLVAVIYFVDMMANGWLFFKLRFDKLTIGV